MVAILTLSGRIREDQRENNLNNIQYADECGIYIESLKIIDVIKKIVIVNIENKLNIYDEICVTNSQ